MAVAASFSGDWQTSLGNRRGVSATLTFSGTYTTGGESLTPAMLGLGALDTGSVLINQGEDGLVFKYDYTNKKVLIYRSAGFTPAGTISKPTFTVTKGAILASSELGLSADAATGTVNNNTIASTLTLTTNSPVSAPTLTGTAVAAAALVEVSNGASLTGIVTQLFASGV